jgi:hypothetical protein
MVLNNHWIDWPGSFVERTQQCTVTSRKKGFLSRSSASQEFPRGKSLKPSELTKEVNRLRISVELKSDDPHTLAARFRSSSGPSFFFFFFFKSLIVTEHRK